MPDRIRLSRAKGWRMPPDTVKVDRSTAFGNPWKPGTPGCVLVPFWYDGKITELWMNSQQDYSAAKVVTFFHVWLATGVARRADLDLTRAGLDASETGFGVMRERLLARLPDLRGKNLACWCPLDAPCHADVLLKMANAR